MDATPVFPANCLGVSPSLYRATRRRSPKVSGFVGKTFRGDRRPESGLRTTLTCCCVIPNSAIPEEKVGVATRAEIAQVSGNLPTIYRSEVYEKLR